MLQVFLYVLTHVRMGFRYFQYFHCFTRLQHKINNILSLIVNEAPLT